MHHLLRVFVLKKQSIKDMEDMSTPKPKSKSMDLTQSPRRLVRRNAAKNFEYTPSVSSSTSPSTSGSSAARTRSLDLPHDLGTSFRIGGNDGELDLVFKSLGFTPEDFEIPEAQYELMKNRSSSDVIRRPRKGDIDPSDPKVQRQEVKKFVEPPPHRFGNSIPSTASIEAETDSSSSGRILSGAMVGNDQKHSGAAIVPLIPNSVGAAGRGGGINGVRPPLLTPPPAMSLPVLDSECSHWDLVSQFGPEDERNSCFRYRPDSSDDDDEVDKINVVDTVAAHGARIGGELSGSCSFTTTNDDDSSSTTTEPVSIISPDGGRRIHITHWEKGMLLGRGSFGSVYEGISSEGTFFAVKEVSLLEQNSQGKQSIYQLEQEIELLSQFEHENIVRYLGTDKDDSTLYIFLELVTQGSLASLYHKYHLRDSHVSAYTRQILMGLKYLHVKNVVHRDIKCANILVASNGTVKLADFGLAKATRLNDLKSCKGTPFRMAPEVFNHQNQGYGLGADIWSLGCTVLEMLTRHVPYFPLESAQALFKIGNGEPPPIPDSLSADARDFIQQCFRVNPKDRPTAAELLDHSFVQRPLFTSLGSESPMRPVRSI